MSEAAPAPPGEHPAAPLGEGQAAAPVGAPAPAAPPPPSVLNAANALTLLRLVLVPVFGWLLLHEGGDGLRAAAAGVFALAVATDRLDGEIARRRHLITDVGKIVDPIADKALMGTALVGLSVLGELPWWVTVVVLARELGITVLRLVVLRYGVMPAGRGGKAKTALQALAVVGYLLPLPAAGHAVAVVVMAAAVVVTVVTGVDYVVSAVRLRSRARSRRPGGDQAQAA
ncbi:MAG: CDP-alcohol phosphatidyltransferase family protein [Kineosporiaceae bacterium]